MEEIMKEKEFSNLLNTTVADVFKLITERLGVDKSVDNEAFKEDVANMGIVISEVAAKYIIATTKFLGADEEDLSEALFKTIRKCVRLRSLDLFKEIIKDTNLN